MKHIITSILTFLTIQIQAQNWIGSQNFVEMYNQSDVVVIGTVSTIENFKQDSTSISRFKMPLKSLTLSSVQTIKGNFNSQHIYYNDIFNGCGYAPILIENLLDKQTLLFGQIRNDSIFQIGSFNESPSLIAKSLQDLERLKKNPNSNNLTEWFYENLQNNTLFQLLNHNISFKEKPLYNILDSVHFTSMQRNKLYDKIKSFEEYNFDNEGIVSLLTKYNDKKLKEILKNFIIKFKSEPYSQVDELMTYIYQMTGDKRLGVLIKKFNNDWRENIRKKVISDFISII